MGESELGRWIEELIEEHGNEWEFMMGSSYHSTATNNIEGSPRRVYWATMTTSILYDGGFKRYAEKGEGYLHIENVEKKYSFEEAIQELNSRMKKFLGNMENPAEAPNSQAEDEI